MLRLVTVIAEQCYDSAPEGVAVSQKCISWTAQYPVLKRIFYNSIVQATLRLLSFLAWPPAIVMIVFATCAALLPDRYTLFAGDLGQIVAAAFYAFVAVSFIARSVPALRRAERLAALTLTALMSVVSVSYFLTIIGRIAAGGSTLKGGPLLEAAILVWISTVLTFSLWYWLLDDGFDFFFPQSESERFPGWSPNFVDYAVLAFTTSTAFSPTDVLPASRRAKLMMTIQSALSLATVAIAAARAVNVL
jgi:hypothetical protein